MVLKRKKTDVSVPSQQAGASDQDPPLKKTRTNPPRHKAARVTTDAWADRPAAKKTRAPRRKKAATVAAQSEPATAVAGPSTQQQVDSSRPSTAKRGRKKKVVNDGQPEPEKRQAQFKSKCTQNIQDRYERVMTQRYIILNVLCQYSCPCRIFMIDRHRNGGELREEFSILGSTGNVST